MWSGSSVWAPELLRGGELWEFPLWALSHVLAAAAPSPPRQGCLGTAMVTPLLQTKVQLFFIFMTSAACLKFTRITFRAGSREQREEQPYAQQGWREGNLNLWKICQPKCQPDRKHWCMEVLLSPALHLSSSFVPFWERRGGWTARSDSLEGTLPLLSASRMGSFKWPVLRSSTPGCRSQLAISKVRSSAWWWVPAWVAPGVQEQPFFLHLQL